MIALDDTGVWQDALEATETLAATVDAALGGAVREVARLVSRPGVHRVIASGNGASYYAAMSLWLASLSGPAPVEVVPVPGGLLARRGFAWRDGDALLAFSSSGEFRDVIEAIEDDRAPRPFAIVTANADSTLGRLAGARALVVVHHQRAVTHTQGYCGAVLAALAVWAEVTRDAVLVEALRSAPGAYDRAMGRARGFAAGLEEVALPVAAAAVSTGPGWAAALESALLLKEIARVPAEGVETREGATSALMGLRTSDLFLAVPTLAVDPLLDESEGLARRAGVPVLRLPTAAPADPRLAPVTTFPSALAVAVVFALRQALDVDRPAWVDAYYATARKPG